MAELKVMKKVKPLQVNEGFPLRPVDVSQCIDNPGSSDLVFKAVLTTGEPLPCGIKCTPEGVISGIPAKKTARPEVYVIKVTAEGEAGEAEFEVSLSIFPAFTADEIAEKYKSAWEEMAKNDELPVSIQEIIERPVSKDDVYYLLSKFASFTLWNADDMRLAEGGALIKIGAVSKKFNIYDFDVCLVATPKDLQDPTRTMGDAIETAKGMIHEAHKRKWNVEFGGFDRMANIAWYEASRVSENSDFKMEVRNYEPPEVRSGQQPTTSGG